MGVLNMHSIMANLNLGQDVSNKRERKSTAAHIMAKSYPLYLAVKMCRYGSLIDIYPSAETLILLRFFYSSFYSFY